MPQTRPRSLTPLLVAGLLPAALALALLWLPDPPPLRSPALRWTLSLATASAAFAGLYAVRWQVGERLRTLANLIGSLREGDYSLRAHPPAGDPALAELAGEVNALAALLHDERLAAREASLLAQQVVDHMDAGVIAFDGQGRCRLANRRAMAWLGLGRDQLQGRQAEELGLASLLATESGRTLELELPHARGRFEVRHAFFRVDGVEHRLVSLQDLTRTLATEERLAWQRLVQVLRHEINNSLAPISSLAAILRDKARRAPRPPAFDQDLEEGLSVIVGRSEALARIIEAYKNLSRLPPPRKAAFPVEAWVADAVSASPAAGIAVDAGRPGELLADRAQLDQLLVNLLRNAAEAAGPGGEVRVAWSFGPDRFFELQVLDDGPGLSGSENLFVPFFTTKKGGTGIGLALSRQIAEAHGGSLTLENRAERSGCVARLRLPAG